jgi:ABC-type transport system substrate-binding protein
MKSIILCFVALSIIIQLPCNPVLAVKGPIMDSLQFRFYDNPASLFTAFMNNEVDYYGWPLTYSQYMQVINDSSKIVAPFFSLGTYEIMFNNNYSCAAYHDGVFRSPFNYTEFRQAMACLVNKDNLIAGPAVNGFGIRVDPPVAPILTNLVNYAVSKYDANGNLINKYPWDFNETHAVEILFNNGWYPTFGSVAAIMAALPLPAGSVKYPPGHQKVDEPLDAIIGYTRSDLPSAKAAGESFQLEMEKVGINVTNNFVSSRFCYAPVFETGEFHFYAGPVSICDGLHFNAYVQGGIPYNIQDGKFALHASLTWDYAKSLEMSIDQSKQAQKLFVDLAFSVELYSVTAYTAVSAAFAGSINYRGAGMNGNPGVTASIQLSSFVVKTGNYPVKADIKIGASVSFPVDLNSVFGFVAKIPETAIGGIISFFSGIFGGVKEKNPYKPTTYGKSPAGGDLPWMAFDWKQETMADGNANVTLWFRHDITWHDGVPLTVDDLNFTIHLHQSYGDSAYYDDVVHIAGFQKWDDWTCSIQFDIPSIYCLYMIPQFILPKHIYEYIAIPADAGSGSSTTGHHGEWPGKDALPSEILPGAPFTWSQLTGTDGCKYVWIGTGMWKYHPGSYVSGSGGGVTLDAFSGFWMNITQGEIDFAYTWNAGPAPQGGSYVIGLSDLVLLANAYGTSGTGAVPFRLGGQGVWEPGCDLAPPAGTVGLSDLVTLAINYGKHWGANP